MALNKVGVAGDETNHGAEGDATKRDVIGDGGTDAAVDPGLVISPDQKTKPEAGKIDDRRSTNHTGLAPDSIQVD
jgi:hypothetical protein